MGCEGEKWEPGDVSAQESGQNSYSSFQHFDKLIFHHYVIRRSQHQVAKHLLLVR